MTKVSLEKHRELITFLNTVFGAGNPFDFEKLLPKLYLEKYDPCSTNEVIRVDGELVAAVGAFDAVMKVGDQTLNYTGIGNVAVSADARGKGHMIQCLNKVLQDKVDAGRDFAVLGGQRQRYGYFGFDFFGVEYKATISRTNLRHVFGNQPLQKLEIRELKEENTQYLDVIYELHSKRALRTLRTREELFDILRSWEMVPKVILKDEVCIGYYTGEYQELTLVSKEYIHDVIRTWLLTEEEIEIPIPMWNQELLDAVNELYEYLDVSACEMINVFNYKRTLEAFLKLKIAREGLADGVEEFFIHGYTGDCRLKIVVKDNHVSVEESEGKEGIELTHKDAIEIFFGLNSTKRNRLKPAIRSWFPLPIYIEQADQV